MNNLELKRVKKEDFKLKLAPIHARMDKCGPGWGVKPPPPRVPMLDLSACVCVREKEMAGNRTEQSPHILQVDSATRGLYFIYC